MAEETVESKRPREPVAKQVPDATAQGGVVWELQYDDDWVAVPYVGQVKRAHAVVAVYPNDQPLPRGMTMSLAVRAGDVSNEQVKQLMVAMLTTFSQRIALLGEEVFGIVVHPDCHLSAETLTQLSRLAALHFKGQADGGTIHPFLVLAKDDSRYSLCQHCRIPRVYGHLYGCK